MKPWRSLHLDIDGHLIDRDTAEYGLELTMSPVGTQLDRKDQVRELEVKIGDGKPGANKAVLDEKGIAALAAFLKLRP